MNELNKKRAKGPITRRTRKSRLLQDNYVWIGVALVCSFAAGLLLGCLGYAYYSSVQSSHSTPPTTALGDEVGTEYTAPLEEHSTPVALRESPTPTWTPEPAIAPTPEPTPTPLPPFSEGPIVYGLSFGGRPLRVYRLGNGPSARAIIGGIHGGYEWNTVELVSDTLTYFQEHQSEVPPDVTLYIIPCANPDGYAAGTDAVVARMNGNGVDLNRNWDYQWQITATHGTRPVKAGDYAFSEPETASLRDFIREKDIELAIFYHSALGGVIFSGADRTESATYELAEMLVPVIGYRHQTEGIPGQITTGDAIDWLSVEGIAAVELELITHQRADEVEWQRNLDGIRAFLNWSIPEPATALPPPEEFDESQWDYITYTVQLNGSLGQIAIDYEIELGTLMYVNGIDNPNAIYEGQVLTIPVRSRQD